MRYALLPVAAAVCVVLAGVLTVVLLPGALATPDAQPEGDVTLREVDVQPTAVSGESVTLAVRSYLSQFGGPVENVSVVLRATDLETGFVADTERTRVGDVGTTGERVVNASVTVPRESGYRLEALLYRDGERVETAGADVRGVGSLTPAYARTTIRFHRFDGRLPAVQFRIEDVADNRTTLNVSTYLTNVGDDAAGDVRLELKVRQSDSNIVADTASVRVSDIRPGRTAAPAALLTVPDEYNYYLDAVLWRDGVVVGTARSAANLAPTEPISVNDTERVGIEVGEFTRDREDGPTTTESSGSGGVPGFTPLAALAAAVAGLLWRRFR